MSKSRFHKKQKEMWCSKREEINDDESCVRLMRLNENRCGRRDLPFPSVANPCRFQHPPCGLDPFEKCGPREGTCTRVQNKGTILAVDGKSAEPTRQKICRPPPLAPLWARLGNDVETAVIGDPFHTCRLIQNFNAT